jgi:outer membrane protein W
MMKKVSMKKISILSLFFVSAFSVKSFAQDSDLKPFKVDVSLGYAIPGGTGSKGGVLFAVEPKYAVASNIAVGLRLETAVVARFSGYDSNGDVMDASVKASGSYLVTGDYYLSENYSFRPFVGTGAGIFTIASAEVNGGNSSGISSGSKFGGLLRAGFEASHFRLGVEYNLVPKTTFNGFDENGNSVSGLTSKNSYIGLKLGICIGGGPR